MEQSENDIDEAGGFFHMGAIVLLGRLCFAAIFIKASFGHFSEGVIGYAAEKGVPLASVAVPLSGVLALVGGLSIALGYKAKWGAWLLVLFLVPVTFMMHNFWAAQSPTEYQIQQIMFLKNIAMLGGALMLTHFGAGPWSLDSKFAAKNY